MKSTKAKILRNLPFLVSSSTSHCFSRQPRAMQKFRNSLIPWHFTLLFIKLIAKSVAVINGNLNTSDQTCSITNVPIGVLSDLSSPMDNMIYISLSIALEDFYEARPDYKTRLHLHNINVKEELDANVAVLEMLKNGEVHGVLGPRVSPFVVDLGARAQVPVISITAENRALSQSQNPNFIRISIDDLYQVKNLAAICEGFGWHEIVVLYEDTEYGSHFVSKLNKGFQEFDIQLASMVAISPSAKDSEITDKLNILMSKQARVFLVHMNIPLGQRFFVLSRRSGMISKGYAWLITDILSNALSSVDSSAMENVVGIRPYVPKSKSLDSFREKWKRNALLMKPGVNIMDLNFNGLLAYDTIWGLAQAIEKSVHLNSNFQDLNLGGNRNENSNIKISQIGQSVLTEFLNTKFTGLHGEFLLADGHLQPLGFEIFNVIGTGDRTVGYWSPTRGISSKVSVEGDAKYSTSIKELRAIMWPGDTLVPPKGWAIPATAKYKVGVPQRDGFPEFVNVQQDPVTQFYNFSGYCIDIFLASLDYLRKYEGLDLENKCDFLPYLDRGDQGSYNDMLHQIVNKVYDFVVGDVTILANRSTFVEFTLPYTESGVVMVLKNKKSIDMWIFLKPLRWDLWLAIAAACIFVGGALALLEHEGHNDKNTLVPQEQQLGIFFWLPIAVLTFPERNMVAKKWAVFVLIIWLFVAYILMQSYTAKLSSIFTVNQLNFAYSTDYNVGYEHGSFVRDFLIQELHLNESKLKSYQTIQEYHQAMLLGSKKGGIDAIYSELPYVRLLLDRYGSEYRIVGPTHKTGGFGFAFPMDSPLASYFSRAILNVTQSPIMVGIEQKNFGPGYPVNLDSINQENPSLTAPNFGGLFIIVILATMFALFCSKTASGRRFASKVSSCGLWFSRFLTNGGSKVKNQSNIRNSIEGSSSLPAEDALARGSDVNNLNASVERDAIHSAGEGEIHLQDISRIVNAS